MDENIKTFFEARGIDLEEVTALCVTSVGIKDPAIITHTLSKFICDSVIGF